MIEKERMGGWKREDARRKREEQKDSQEGYEWDGKNGQGMEKER